MQYNNQNFIDIPTDTLLPFINVLIADHRATNIVFQQDNAWLHIAKTTQMWMSNGSHKTGIGLSQFDMILKLSLSEKSQFN